MNHYTHMCKKPLDPFLDMPLHVCTHTQTYTHYNWNLNQGLNEVNITKGATTPRAEGACALEQVTSRSRVKLLIGSWTLVCQRPEELSRE
jgi:hypothetical protein